MDEDKGEEIQGGESTFFPIFLSCNKGFVRTSRKSVMRLRRLKLPKAQSSSCMPPPLFEVPGWSVSTELASSPSKKTKKRKRPHGSDAPSEKLESVQVNLEKLMHTLDPGESTKRPPKKKHKGKQSSDSCEGVADKKSPAAAPPKGSVKKGKIKDAREPPKKSTEARPMSKEKGESESQQPTKVINPRDPNLTTLQNRMKKKLDGARFR